MAFFVEEATAEEVSSRSIFASSPSSALARLRGSAPLRALRTLKP